MVQVLREAAWQFSKSLNTELLHDRAIPVLALSTPTENDSTHPHTNVSIGNSIFHNCQKVGKTQVPISGKTVDKQNVVYPSGRIFFCQRKEQSADTCYNLR